MVELPAMARSTATDAFFAEYRHTPDVSTDHYDVVYFGDTVAMADELCAMVLAGPKRATAGLLRYFEVGSEPPPVVGGHVVLIDGVGTPSAVWRTTDVRVGPLSSVDDAFAWDEGEGDRTRDDWLDGHRRFFARQAELEGFEFHDDIETVFERFTVVWPPEVADRPRPVAGALRINLWSGPRNVSTALMYSFRQRVDTRVVDEPLYAHYLSTIRDRSDHPGTAEVLASMSADAGEVSKRVIFGLGDRPVLFCKQMAHHLVPGVPRRVLTDAANVLLIRDPYEVLVTIVDQLPNPTMRDIGIARQAELFDELHSIGQRPAVVDARLLLLDPGGVLRELCERLDLAFDPAMLSWPAGPKPEDGVWAPHWYRNAHASTGFAPYMPKTTPLPDHLSSLATSARDSYERLLPHALTGAHP